MSTFVDINNALLNPIINNNDFGIAFNYENKNTLPDVDGPFGQAFLLPVQPEQKALGQDGCDQHTGVFQISLRFPENTGNIAILTKADEIAIAYKSGTVLTYNGVNVTIESVGIAQGFNDGPWFLVPITINYYSFIRRTP